MSITINIKNSFSISFSLKHTQSLSLSLSLSLSHTHTNTHAHTYTKTRTQNCVGLCSIEKGNVFGFLPIWIGDVLVRGFDPKDILHIFSTVSFSKQTRKEKRKPQFSRRLLVFQAILLVLSKYVIWQQLWPIGWGVLCRFWQIKSSGK